MKSIIFQYNQVFGGLPGVAPHKITIVVDTTPGHTRAEIKMHDKSCSTRTWNLEYCDVRAFRDLLEEVVKDWGGFKPDEDVSKGREQVQGFGLVKDQGF